MPTNTYVALDKVTVGTATPSITFTSIPQGYTDLVLVMSAATTHTLSTFPMVQFNGDTGSNYSVTELYGTGSAAGSARDTNTTSGWIGFDISLSNTVGDHTTIANFMNYSNSTTYKTWLSRANRASSALDYQGTDAVVGLWRSTAAITSMTVKNRRGGVDYNFAVGSTFSLYGIKAEPVPTAKATGGTIYYGADGYTYHKFTSSGTFTPTVALTCDALVVAGGGGGGTNTGGGGGGAGGLLAFTSQSLSATGYTVTVGAGGAGGTSLDGTNGADSQFGALTLVKGGGGGAGANQTSPRAGVTGGSGGGGSSGNTGNNPGAGGSATSGQGNAGGASTNSSGGGGGGAGAVGATGATGVGGNGLNTYSTWATITSSGANNGYYAGGGAGSWYPGGTGRAGGLGGGGTGGNYQGNTQTAGTANTGGGGGAGGGTSTINAQPGGSGIVIIRYVSA